MLKALPPIPRPFNFRLAYAIPLGLMALMLCVDPSPLDLAIAHMMYSPQTGFIGDHSFFLEDVLHDYAKQLIIVCGLLTIAALITCQFRPKLKHWRRPLSYLVLAVALSTSVITPLKALTNVPCPWSITEFGGSQTHTPLLSSRADNDKPGRCWPGGHASTGFSWLALFFVWRDRRPRAAKAALIGVLAVGTIFSVGRMLQGAHFLSHNIWTLLICWLISLSTYYLILYRPALAKAPLKDATGLRTDTATE